MSILLDDSKNFNFNKRGIGFENEKLWKQVRDQRMQINQRMETN